MLNFRLFGFPVRVDWTFWLICLLLGLPYASMPGAEGIKLMAMWTAVVFASIIWHELGHAFARKRYGEPYSEILLYSFGGLCSGPGHFTRGQSMAISAAGPAASLLLGAATFLLTFTPGISNPMIATFVGMMLWVNVGWAFMNLLPILPLDGGRIFEAFMSNRNPSLVPKVGLVVAGIVAVLGLMGGQLYIAILFGYLGYGNWQRMKGLPTQRF